MQAGETPPVYWGKTFSLNKTHFYKQTQDTKKQKILLLAKEATHGKSFA